jgi:adenosylmethionine-8-amino-7-oxononanoate aminotransferase
MLEPVPGTLVRPIPHGYLSGLAAHCRSAGIHLIMDEVTTGAGRAGAMTVSERLDVKPDMVVLGKGLSAGYFPLAALAVSAEIYAELARTEHRIGFLNGSTTDGHPVGMAAGLAVLDVITAPGFLLMGLELVDAEGRPWDVGEVNRLRLACRDNGLLTSFSRGVMPLLPPLTISPADGHVLAERLAKTIRGFEPRPAR